MDVVIEVLVGCVDCTLAWLCRWISTAVWRVAQLNVGRGIVVFEEAALQG